MPTKSGSAAEQTRGRPHGFILNTHQVATASTFTPAPSYDPDPKLPCIEQSDWTWSVSATVDPVVYTNVNVTDPAVFAFSEFTDLPSGDYYLLPGGAFNHIGALFSGQQQRTTAGALPILTIRGSGREDPAVNPVKQPARYDGLCRISATRVKISRYLTGEVCSPVGFPYTPELRLTKAGLRAADPKGSCSSKVWLFGPGDTGRSFNFSDACDTHDYGYDLLRFFDIGGQARRDVDNQLARDMNADCNNRSFITKYNCRDWADTFAVAVEGNSLAQRYRPPSGQIG